MTATRALAIIVPGLALTPYAPEFDVKRRWQLANETGKRYSCKICSSEFVVTRGADGSIACCGEPMSKKS